MGIMQTDKKYKDGASLVLPRAPDRESQAWTVTPFEKSLVGNVVGVLGGKGGFGERYGG